MSRLRTLQGAGVSIWLDTLSRELLDTGAFARLIADDAVTGATSNPTIFAKAITGSDRYDDQLRELSHANVTDLREAFFALALQDVSRAAELLRPVYERTAGGDGFVSFECTPDLADDASATVAQALDLWQRLAAPNVMIKVPATEAGLEAIEQLTRVGVNVNVTLLFSVARYEQVIEAYLRGLEARAGAGEPLQQIASVASFFVSRIDVKADPLLPADSAVRGRIAIANARVAYLRYQRWFSGARWAALERAGARPQRPLWASTGTKDPAYSDVVYVEELIGPDMVNTMPEPTLRAFADHGRVTRTIDARPGEAERTLRTARTDGVDLERITAELEREGVQAFCASYRQLLDRIRSKLPMPGRQPLPNHPPQKPASSATHRLLAQLRHVPNLTMETDGSRIDIRHGGETLATLDQEGAHLDIVVPRRFVPVLLAKVPAARRTASGLTVDLEGSASVRAAASLVRMRIDEARFDWQFSHRGP